MLEVDILGSGVSSRARCWPRPVALWLIVLVCLSSRSAAADPPAAATQAAPGPAVPLAVYVLGAIGLSGISVAATTGFLALSQKGLAEDHCSPTLRACDAAGRAANDTGRTLRDISTAAWIVGGVGIGLGAYLWLTAPTQRSQVGLAVSVDGASPQAAIVAHF